jgi:hypothetical protein
MSTVTKWMPTTDRMLQRRMGKTGEKLGELSAVTNRILIQGIDEIDPSSGKTNRHRLEDEIADVYAQLDENISRLGLNVELIEQRRQVKRGYMQEWEEMYLEPTP